MLTAIRPQRQEGGRAKAATHIGIDNWYWQHWIAPAMICCEATLVGRAILSPPRRVGDNEPYRYCVRLVI